MSSLSIVSRVERVSSSTSAAVRWDVGIGGRTVSVEADVYVSQSSPRLFPFQRVYPVGKRDGRTFDRYPPRPKPLLPHTQHPPIIRTHNRYNGHARLHREVKCPFLKRPHDRPIRITPRALRENENTLPLPPHLPRGGLKCFHRAFAIRPVNEHSPTQRHEPAQKRHSCQTALRSHTAEFRKYSPQQQDIQLRLMIANQHARSRIQILFALHDFEPYTCCESHGILKSAGGGPLGDAVVAEGAEEEGGEDAVDGAEDEGAVGGEEAGVEGGAGDVEEGGEGEEGERGAEVEGENAEEDEEGIVHCRFWLLGL